MPLPPAKVVPRLRRLIEEGEQLPLIEVDAWVERARLAVAAAYGEDSPNLERFEGVRYSLPFWTGSTPESAFDSAKVAGAREAVRMLQAFAEDLDEGAATDGRMLPSGVSRFSLSMAATKQFARRWLGCSTGSVSSPSSFTSARIKDAR